MRAGRIYVLRNENMKELLVKVGKTIRTAEERAGELTRATGVAGRFHVLLQEEVADVDYAEQLVHERLKAHRLQPNREFFQVPYQLAIRTVFETCSEVNKNLAPAPVVRMRINMGSQSDANGLREVLEPHRGGDVQVLVVFQNAKAACEVYIGESWHVHFSPKLAQEMQVWLGADNVLFVRWPRDAERVPLDGFEL
jgi:hypothetical protein